MREPSTREMPVNPTYGVGWIGKGARVDASSLKGTTQGQSMRGRIGFERERPGQSRDISSQLRNEGRVLAGACPGFKQQKTPVKTGV